MARSGKILGYVLLIVILSVMTECASSKRNPYLEKRENASRVNTTQLGRNRYYFSSNYQKRLIKSYRARKNARF